MSLIQIQYFIVHISISNVSFIVCYNESANEYFSEQTSFIVRARTEEEAL